MSGIAPARAGKTHRTGSAERKHGADQRRAGARAPQSVRTNHGNPRKTTTPQEYQDDAALD